MKKILFLAVFIAHFVTFASAFEAPNILSITIPKQADSALDSANVGKNAESSIKIPAMDLKVGESGIVTRVVNDNEFIIANALVSEVKDGVAVVAISDFTQMSEKYLPKPLGKVAQGDKITFRILYDRALLIAPNQSVYQDISAQFGWVDFLHSDIFAMFLSKEGKNMPDSANFTRFCEKYDVGLVFVALRSRIEILNCASFKKIAFSSFRLKDRSVKKPFFTRLSDEAIDEIFNPKKIENYFAYFGKLVADSAK